MKENYFVASFSGGKDSSAMVLHMVELGMKIDEVICCDTFKEFPAMYRHIAKVRKVIEAAGIKFTDLKAKETFDYLMFEHIPNRKNKTLEGKVGYVKELSPLDYDLPIVNRALVEYMVHGVPVRRTVMECNELKEFQLVSKISGKYTHILHGNKIIKEKCIRIFASTKDSDAGVQKVHAVTKKPAKIPNSPEHSFIFNDEVNGVTVPETLNKQWYIDLANKRLADFGVI